jgi:predicted nucleic acid-binding protein
MNPPESTDMSGLSRTLQLCMGMMSINSDLNVRMVKILAGQSTPEERRELMNDIIQCDVSINLTIDILKEYEDSGSKLDVEEYIQRNSQKHVATSLTRSEERFGTAIDVKLVDEDELKQLLRDKKDDKLMHVAHLSETMDRLARLSTETVSVGSPSSRDSADPGVHCPTIDSDQRRTLTKRKVPHMASMQNGRRRGGRPKQQRRF